MTIRVRPGATRAGVGGRRGGALVVAVNARAVDGQATEAALRAVADAFAVRRADVRLIAGAKSRDKIVEIAGPEAVLAARLAALAAGP